MDTLGGIVAMITAYCFNWATSFQPWIQPPFFGLCCYRKKADFRTYRQLLWILL